MTAETILTIAGLILAIGALILDLKVGKDLAEIRKTEERIRTLSEKASRDLDETILLEKSIADYTRKPLNGIVEILSQCYELLKMSETVGGKIWFVGLTLGFGPAHNVKFITESWDIKHRTLKFETMYSNFNEILRSIIGGATIRCIVCLKKGNLTTKFLKPLSTKDDYKPYADQIIKSLSELEELHSSVEQLIVARGKEKGKGKGEVYYNEVHYLESIPLQMIVTEIKKDDSYKKACVVFHVGSENVKSREVQGFYSELPNICDMFINYAESLYGATMNNEGEE